MADPGIGTYVRYWLHYNNLSSSFYKQFCEAKKIQEQYVQQIIDILTKTKMEKAIIQIGGGHLSVSDKRTAHPLSLNKIQELLHMYYKHRGGKDETKDIMTFINANRGFTMTKYIKKTGIPTPQSGGTTQQVMPPVPQLMPPVQPQLM